MSANVKEMSRTRTRRKLGVCASTLATVRTEFKCFVFFFFLGIDATTELQWKLKKEINKAARRVFERPGSILHLSSCVIDHHTHRWNLLVKLLCLFFPKTAPVSLMHDVNRQHCRKEARREKTEMRSRADGKDLMSAVPSLLSSN